MKTTNLESLPGSGTEQINTGVRREAHLDNEALNLLNCAGVKSFTTICTSIGSSSNFLRSAKTRSEAISLWYLLAILGVWFVE